MTIVLRDCDIPFRTPSLQMYQREAELCRFSPATIPKLNEAHVSWINEPGLLGYVSNLSKARVSGTATGIDSSQHQIVIHWFNSAAQYWVYASSSGAFTSPAMKPGTYTMVLYQTEFEVARISVVVSSGSTAHSNITSTFPIRNLLWQVGRPDGQPFGFRCADKFLRMHPSDSRMSGWGALTYTVESSSETDFAMALFKDANAPQTINFNLNSAPSGSATLRIATTLSFAGG